MPTDGQGPKVSGGLGVYVVVDTTSSMAAEDWGDAQPRLDGGKADVQTLVAVARYLEGEAVLGYGAANGARMQEFFGERATQFGDTATPPDDVETDPVDDELYWIFVIPFGAFALFELYSIGGVLLDLRGTRRSS